MDKMLLACEEVEKAHIDLLPSPFLSLIHIFVIEHNLEVIKTADYIIDMGPEGGSGGGTVVAAGTPEEICEVEKSYTGQYLKGILNR